MQAASEDGGAIRGAQTAPFDQNSAGQGRSTLGHGDRVPLSCPFNEIHPKGKTIRAE